VSGGWGAGRLSRRAARRLRKFSSRDIATKQHRFGRRDRRGAAAGHGGERALERANLLRHRKHRPMSPLAPHSEATAKSLIENEAQGMKLSEWRLIRKADHLDFGSAIPRFEFWRPSQRLSN
jgi:hypothetical protein